MDHIDYVKKIHMWGTAAPMFIVFVIITLVKGGSAGNYSGASPAYSLSYLMLALLAVFLCIRGLASLVFYLAKKDGSKHAMLSLINMPPRMCRVCARPGLSADRVPSFGKYDICLIHGAAGAEVGKSDGLSDFFDLLKRPFCPGVGRHFFFFPSMPMFLYDSSASLRA